MTDILGRIVVPAKAGNYPQCRPNATSGMAPLLRGDNKPLRKMLTGNDIAARYKPINPTFNQFHK